MAETVSPIERTLRFATNVADLSAAWSFVMEYVDRVGPAPSIEILPMWRFNDDDTSEQLFTVVVSGMEHEGAKTDG